MRTLIRRREIWLPTWRGWFLIVAAYLALMIVVVWQIHPFLAQNMPLRGSALVVEGWLPDYALEEAIKQFTDNHYKMIYVTGGPLERGAPLSEYGTFAEMGAATLVRLGLDPGAVQAVPAPLTRKDRTYASAIALRDWFRSKGSVPASFDLLSEGPHSRRSRLLFAKAFAHDSRVGVISVESLDYDPARWWKYSAGVRGVISEFLSYCYAVLFFSEANG